VLAPSSLKTPLHYAVSHSLRQSASLHSYRGETFTSSQMMGFSAVSNRSEQQSYRHHSAPLDDAIGRCCSEFGVLAVSSGKVGKVDCCGLMRGAGASTAGLLLSLSVACRHCRRRSLTLSRFFLSQGFRSYIAEVYSAELIIRSRPTH